MIRLGWLLRFGTLVTIVQACHGWTKTIIPEPRCFKGDFRHTFDGFWRNLEKKLYQMLDFHDFSCFFVVTDFIWTVLRCYLELDVEVATGNTLGLEIFVFREKNICSAEKK